MTRKRHSVLLARLLALSSLLSYMISNVGELGSVQTETPDIMTHTLCPEILAKLVSLVEYILMRA